jgi:hypothetical protein
MAEARRGWGSTWWMVGRSCAVAVRIVRRRARARRVELGVYAFFMVADLPGGGISEGSMIVALGG